MKMFRLLKAVWKIRKPAKTIMKEIEHMKNEPGIKTTEFWMNILAAVAQIAGVVAGVLDAQTAVYVIAAQAAIYEFVRTWRKNRANGTD